MGAIETGFGKSNVACDVPKNFELPGWHWQQAGIDHALGRASNRGMKPERMDEPGAGATLALASLMVALALMPQALAGEPASAEPADPLTAVYYRFAVVEYCGLADQDVANGFALARDRILTEQQTDDDAHRSARIAGWTAADLEWSNRGLGGYRRWCESEGYLARSGFLEEGRPDEP
jgi:hypothetical protein